MHVNVPFDIVDTPELRCALTGSGWYQRLGGIAKVANHALGCPAKQLRLEAFAEVQPSMVSRFRRVAPMRC